MKISLNWLSQFVKIPTAEKLDKIVVGRVIKLEKHPDAEKLNVAQVDVGNETLQIVCGGTNLKQNQLVPVALIGAHLPGNITIEKAVLRGVESCGMICAKEEIRLGHGKRKEIMVLDTTEKPGTPLKKALKLDGYSPEEIQSLFTIRTAEVEGIEFPANKLRYVVTGKLLEFEKLEASEKLHKALVDIGDKKIHIIFGSVHEVKIGWILPIALPGAIMSNGTEIKKTKIMGAESEGMIADDNELGIPLSSGGLMIFPKNTPLGVPVADVLDMHDTILEIDNKSLTHRPDLWGHYGIAREMAAIFETELEPYEGANCERIAKYSEAQIKKSSPLRVQIKDAEICRRFTACIITGVTVAESPNWLKQKLAAIGINPINNVVDITNFVMYELGQPMHAYDRAVVGSDIFEIKFAHHGDTIETIDHRTRVLTKDDPIITNGKIPLTIAGIMGGASSEIGTRTTEIILEAANWHPSIVRLSSQRHSLRTEAVQRFEKHLDPTMTMRAITRALHLLKEICPEVELEGGIVDIYPEPIKEKTITISPRRIEQKIGAIITESEIENILKRLGFGVKSLKITIPTWRATNDVSHEDDIVEEVARLYGYEKIPEHIPELPIRLPEPNAARNLEYRCRAILSRDLGFTETSHYSFYSRDDLQKTHLPEDLHLQVANYLSLDQTHMQISLVPNLLKTIAKNLRFKKSFKLYEIARTYTNEHTYFPREETILAAAIVGPAIVTPATDNKNTATEKTLLEAKGVLEAVIKKLGIPITEQQKGTDFCPPAHPHRRLNYATPNATIARIYELSPIIAKNFDIEDTKVAIIEIHLTNVAAEHLREKKYKPIPRFPGINFDISLLIDKAVPAGTIQAGIEQTAPDLITDTALFDHYEGENVPSDKKSLAFHIQLQADDRTLTDEEMKAAEQKIHRYIESIGGTMR